MNIKQLSLLSISMGLLCAAQAEEQLDPIIVSATRSPQSAVTTPATITTIGAAEIAASGSRNLAELLTGQSGLQVTDLYGNGSKATVSMRGFSGGNAPANVLILVDGMRLNNTDLSAPDLAAISLKEVERVEIIQGSAGTLYGDQAVGGVINIITRTPREGAATLSASGGDLGERRLFASAEGRLGTLLGIRFSGEGRDADNYRLHNAETARRVSVRTDYRGEQGTAFAEYRRSSDRLELPGALSLAQAESDPRQVDPSKVNDLSDTTQQASRVGLQYALSSEWQLAGEVTERRDEGTVAMGSSSMEQRRRQLAVTPRLIGTLPNRFGDMLFTVGFDAEDLDYRLTSAWSGAWGSGTSSTDSQQRVRSLYAQGVIPVAPTLTVTLGGRRADLTHTVTDSFTFPAGQVFTDSITVTEAGLAWEPAPEWRLFARRDGNFRFPLVDENTYTLNGSAGLETQRGVSWEGGAEWRNGVQRAKVLLYRLDLENEIDFDSTVNAPFGANVNLPPTRRLGAVVEAGARPTSELGVTLQYTFVEPTIEGGSNRGKLIPFVARHNARVAAEYRFYPGWMLMTEFVHTGERVQSADYANALPLLPAVDLINLNLTWQGEHWEGGVRVGNVAGVKYNAFATGNGYYPAPERNALLTATYRF